MQHLSWRQLAVRRGEKVRRPCVECSAFLLCPIIPVAWVGQTPPLRLGAVLTEVSGDFLTPPPPAEKAAARQDQAGHASTDDGAWNCLHMREAHEVIKIPIATLSPKKE